jgi:hypothetical protein
MRDVALSVTTNADGDGTGWGERATGLLYAVRWNQGTLENTTDAVLGYVNSDGDVVTLLTLTDVTASALYYPRHQCHGATGAALSGIYDPPLVSGQLKLVVAQGGDTLSGGCTAIVEDVV